MTFFIFSVVLPTLPVLVTARSKAWACGRSFAGFAGSNPAGDLDICCECCFLGIGLCDGPITRPEESYRVWCVVVCDLESSGVRRPWPTGGLLRQNRSSYRAVNIPFGYNNQSFNAV